MARGGGRRRLAGAGVGLTAVQPRRVGCVQNDMAGLHACPCAALHCRDVFDTPAAIQAQFALDWSRIVAKSRFCKLVGREDKVRPGARHA